MSPRVAIEAPGAALLRDGHAATEGERLVPKPELLRDLRALWQAVLERSQHPSEHRRLRILLPDMQPQRVLEGELLVQTHPSLLLASRGVADELRMLVRRLTGADLRIVVQAPEPAPDATAAAQPDPQADAQRIAEHPLIKHAVELFGGKIVGRQVRKRQEEG